MKLGLWNRLAVVGLVLSLLIAPVVDLLLVDHDIQSLREMGYQTCLGDAARNYPEPLRIAQRLEAEQRCLENRFPIPDPNPALTWNNWWGAFTATAFVYALAYGLIWLTAWTCRWVWAGRKSRSDK